MHVRTGMTAALTTALAALPLGLASPAQAVPPTCAGQTATTVGTTGNDDLLGTEGHDVVYLGAGNDRFRGLGGDDVVCGGPGDDALYGQDGNDTLYGEDGNDHLVGSAGNDTVDTGSGANTVTEGLGDDTLRGGPGTDQLNYQYPSFQSTSGVVIDTAAGTAHGYGDDTLSHFEKFLLTRNDDTFHGRDVLEQVLSEGGDDTIWTAGGNDWVDLGPGTQIVNTGPGDDTVLGTGDRATRVSLSSGNDQAFVGLAEVVSGGDGNDKLSTRKSGSRLVGGAGSDTVYAVGSRQDGIGASIDLPHQRVHILYSTWQWWHLDSIENATGTPFDDFMLGTSGANVLRGGEGDDVIWGNGGNDSISGGGGDDVIRR